jgi:hypothetical protein
MIRVRAGCRLVVMRMGVTWQRFMRHFMNVFVSLKVTGHERRRLPLQGQDRE